MHVSVGILLFPAILQIRTYFIRQQSSPSPHHHPSLSDISLHTNNSLIFKLRRSKTDQLRISFPIYIFRLNSYLIPYEPLTKYLSARCAAHPTPQHPLFSPKQEKWPHISFSKHPAYFWDIRRTLVKPFLPHRCSVHIGAASTAARLGIYDQTIQVLGHWLSQANHAYICNNLNNLRHAHAQLSSI